MYVPLHVHYENGTLGNSILNIDDAILKANRLGIKAMSITDCSMSCIYEFYKKCLNNNIKPIFGLEVKYKIDNDTYNLILLAKNKKGFSDLLYINNYNALNLNSSNILDLNVIAENSKDIIVLSGGYSSHPYKIILEEYHKHRSLIDYDYEKVVSCIDKYINTFKDFYLMIEPNLNKEQIFVNKMLIKIALMNDFRYVITPNIHYLNVDDNKSYTRYKILQEDNAKLFSKNPNYYLESNSLKYLMSYEELLKSLYYLDDNIIYTGIKKSIDISNQVISFDILDLTYKTPVFINNKYSTEDYIRKLCLEKIENIKEKLQAPFKYINRLEYELNILSKNKYLDFILIIKDIIDFAVANDIIIGPGRGSCCGSLVLYLLGVTKIDPIKYDLMFERFVSSGRKEKADIDIDISASKRNIIISYIIQKYGYYNCCSLINYDKRGFKGAFKDSLDLYNIDKKISDKVYNIVLKKLKNNNKLMAIDILKYDSDLCWYRNKYFEWFDTMIGLIGTNKNISSHQSGLIISSKPIHTCVPIGLKKIETGRSDFDNILYSQMSYDDINNFNFIKYDFLSSNILDVIDKTCKDNSIKIDLDNINFFNDINVWNLICSRKTLTLFQISSKLYNDRLYRLKPKSIEDLAKCLALIRTPCIKLNLDKEYIDILENKKGIKFYHNLYNNITDYTNGILLFQEDMIKILNNFNFSIEESYKIMKLAAHKNLNAINKVKDKFLKNAEGLSVEPNTANAIWDIIYSTGDYLLNKSHATSYAILTYITAYLKTYYYNTWISNYISIMYNNNYNNKNVINLLNEFK